MKRLIIILILLISSICPGQQNNQMSRKPVKDSSLSKNGKDEKQDIPFLKLNRIMTENKLYFNPSEAEYNADFKKLSLKEIVGKGQTPDQENAETNAKNILNDINKSMEDKRSALQKVVQTALGIAQTAVVVGLAAREIINDNKKK